MLRRASIVALATAAFASAAGDPVAAIIDLARGAPVEIFTDVVFHLLDTGQIPEKERVPLLDEVFLRASDARQAWPQRPAIIPGWPQSAPSPMPSVPGRTIHYSTAPRPPVTIPAQIRLDTLSIQCRVVQAMLGIDGKHARELFSRVPRPGVPKTDCKGAILENPTPYFETVEAVVTHAPFTAKEQEDRVPFWTMESTVRGIQSSLEITPAARSLFYLVHDDKDALAMAGAFAVALGIDDSDRNFSGAIQSNMLDAVQVVVDRFAKLGAPPAALQSALRGFLVRHLSETRCEDSAADYAGAVATFNAAIAGQTAVPPIAPEESTPSKVEGKAEISKPADDPAYREIVQGVNALLKDPNASTGVFAKLREWKGADGDDPVDVFRRKTGMYFELQGPGLSLKPGVPDGALYQAATAGLIATLSDPDILDRAPCDWLQVVKNLDHRLPVQAITRVAGQNVSQDMFFLSQDVFAPHIAQALAGSSLAALQIYGRLSIQPGRQ